jgi:anthranilate phosphoribosyltransferase
VLDEAIAQLAAGTSLTMEQMSDAIDAMMQGTCDSASMAQFLLGLKAKGETGGGGGGHAAAHGPHSDSADRRGGYVRTGGDGSRTFNISTAAALVTAAAGVPVAKHGNRKITSLSGSADVLAALGVGIEADVSVVERCLDELGICFCFAPQLHPAMRHVAAVRRELGVPTIFNLLGPLSNPAGAPYQLLGVGKSSLRALLAAALSRLGSTRAAVVCGQDGLDEVTLCAATDVSLITDAGVEERTWNPRDFGLTPGDRDALRAETPEESAAVIRRILEGEAGPPRDIVVMNAAAAIWVAHGEADLRQAAERAAGAIDTGEAKKLLARLAEATRS